MEITKHFTATTIIVYKNKALLHLHKKLGIWLPVGGHIDQDDKQLFRPMHILLEDINQFHQHIDFIYYATSESAILRPQNGETTNLKWLTSEEIKNLTGLPGNVKVLSLEAIKLLKP